MSNIKWTHDDINKKIMEVMKVSQPEQPFGKASLGGLLDRAKQIPQNLLGIGRKTSPDVSQRNSGVVPVQTGKNTQAG